MKPDTVNFHGCNSDVTVRVDGDNILSISSTAYTGSETTIMNSSSIYITNPKREDIQALVNLLTEGYLK